MAGGDVSLSVGALSWARDLSRCRDATLDGGDVTFSHFWDAAFQGGRERFDAQTEAGLAGT